MMQLIIPAIISQLYGDINTSAEVSRIVRACEVAIALHEINDSITPTTALQNALAAVDSESSDIKAELLLAIASHESRFTPTAVSRVEKGTRVTGVPRWLKPSMTVNGPYFCGVTQAEAGMSWQACRDLQDLTNSYKKTTDELHKWLSFCSRIGRAGDMNCALLGYAGGVAAVRENSHPYPLIVIGVMNKILRVRRKLTNI